VTPRRWRGKDGDATTGRMPGDGGAPLAVVTGASSGIGLAFARELSRRGHTVLAVARREDRLLALAAERPLDSGAVHPLVVDLAEDGAVRRIREAAGDLGGAAWLVNNAGFGQYGVLPRADPKRLSRMVRVNCEAVVLLTHVLLPDLIARRGAILNVASTAAFQPTPFMAVYGATKAFVLSFSEALREELTATGVRVTALCPGPVATEFGEVAGYRGRLHDPPGALGADEVARFGLAAVRRGKAIAVPGPLYKATCVAAQLFPRGIVRRVSRAVLRPSRPAPRAVT
jgi:short-subunit dehydrogenase